MIRDIKVARVRYLQNLYAALADAGLSACLAESSSGESCVLVNASGGGREVVTVARVEGVFWFVRPAAGPVAAVTDLLVAVTRLGACSAVAARETAGVAS